MSTKKKSIKGTKTEKCLVEAYMSESEAYTLYVYYAKQATKENYFGIADVFQETADNELHHGKVFFKYLEGGDVDVDMKVCAGTIGDTASNLAQAAQGERTEGVEQYKKSAEIAESEGFTEIAEHFRAIAKVELRHERRFARYKKQVEEGTVWKRDKPIRWLCLVCGYVYEGTEPPAECPGCDHPREHYVPLD